METTTEGNCIRTQYIIHVIRRYSLNCVLDIILTRHHCIIFQTTRTTTLIHRYIKCIRVWSQSIPCGRKNNTVVCNGKRNKTKSCLTNQSAALYRFCCVYVSIPVTCTKVKYKGIGQKKKNYNNDRFFSCFVQRLRSRIQAEH